MNHVCNILHVLEITIVSRCHLVTIRYTTVTYICEGEEVLWTPHAHYL